MTARLDHLVVAANSLDEGVRWCQATLGVTPKKTVTYTKFELPPARSGSTTFVESAEELVQKLHSVAKVL